MDRFEQRKLTRARLIDSAMKLFSTRGYDHATIDDISQDAGYSKGAYYFHFSTKEDILIELLRRWSEDRAAALAGAAGDEDGHPDVRSMLEALFSYESDRRWPGVLLEFWAQSMRNEDVKKRVSQVYASSRQELARAFADAEAKGELHVESAEDAATIALATHDGYAVQLAIGAPSGVMMTPAQLAEALLTPLEAAPETARRAAAI